MFSKEDYQKQLIEKLISRIDHQISFTENELHDVIPNETYEGVIVGLYDAKFILEDELENLWNDKNYLSNDEYINKNYSLNVSDILQNRLKHYNKED